LIRRTEAVDGIEHKLPKSIERYLAALSKLYAQDGNRALQEIIVNAQTRVAEGWTYDNWNGGTYGHALYLVVPESVFLVAAKKRDEVQTQICRDLNTLHNIQNESIAEVFLEMEVVEDRDWRQESGLLISTTAIVAPDSVTRIWGDKGFRLFLSHKSEVKEETAKLKERLGRFGVSAFVAHEDIKPSRAWQTEIESALHSMDAFAALMTEGFHDSDWTDQEVGFALARGVPVIAVKLGRDPYGFLGKFQALRADWDSAALGIMKLLLGHDRMFSAYIQALRDCKSWDVGNVLADALPGIERASDQQIDELVAAANDNTEVRYSFGFRGNKQAQYGPGLIPHLHRLGPRRFARGENDVIVPASQIKRRQRETEDDEIPF
jgi:TIR domain-containing protein